MRFVNQTSELDVPVPDGIADADLNEALRQSFHGEFVRTFGRDAYWSNGEMEIVNLRVTAVAPSATGFIAQRPAADRIRPPATRKVHWPFAPECADWSIRDRVGLREGDTLAGATIVELADTTVVIPPGCTATIDAMGNLFISFAE